MAVSASASLSTFFSEHKPFEPNTEAIRQRLHRKGVFPTPKILHALRKKETQKAFRRSKKRTLQEQPPPLSEAQRRALEDDALFRTVSAEYGAVREELRRRDERVVAVSGRPWEGSKAVDLRGLASAMETPGGGRLRTEHLEELRRMLAERNEERFRWLLVNDEVEDTAPTDRGLVNSTLPWLLVLNACVPSRQWKGVFWVLEQMRHRGVKPIGATYGLAMEVSSA
ncbi:hypothetical protein BHM03_00002837 [Ensete ventricosum]|nr:hypothetical protein BHM03_00002837 [Ensete ventricosum]